MKEIKVKTAQMTDSEYESELESLNVQKYNSKLNCLNSHKGLRSAEISTIIGPKGGGKSSFIRTIEIELLMQERRIYSFLSEELLKKYNLPIYKSFKTFLKEEDKVNYYLQNLFVDSQLELPKECLTIEWLIHRIEHMIENHAVDCIIFDNFTTSFICSQLPFRSQAMAIHEFKRIAIKYDVPFLLVIHTAKGTDVYKDLIDGENVRGDATSVNMGSYNYIISAFFRCNPVRTFLSIDKARYHGSANKTVFELHYDKELGIFTKDERSNQLEIQRVINGFKKQSKKVSIKID